MAFSAPEAKKPLDILLAGSAERTALRHTPMEILGRLVKNFFNYDILKPYIFKIGISHQRLNKYITSVKFHNLSTLLQHILISS